MKRWKAVAAAAGLLFFVFVLVPVRYTNVCGFERGGLHFPRDCYKQYESLSGIGVHPVLAIFVVMCVLVAGLAWLLRRPSPRFINRIMAGRGFGFLLARALLYIGSGALLIGVFFVAPLWVIELTDSTEYEWHQWAALGMVFAIYTFLIAFGPRDAWSRRWGSSRHPSALLGPDREPPPDSRRN